jgi:uncharacterized protein (TIGR02452 family)
LKTKIQLIFRTGAENGHDSLVLGAFGCGVFKCPAEAVARLMAEVNREEYRSIYDDHNSSNTFNVNGLVSEVQ